MRQVANDVKISRKRSLAASRLSDDFWLAAVGFRVELGLLPRHRPHYYSINKSATMWRERPEIRARMPVFLLDILLQTSFRTTWPSVHWHQYSGLVRLTSNKAVTPQVFFRSGIRVPQLDHPSLAVRLRSRGWQAQVV